MQIFQGEALEAWSRLSEEEQQGIAADYAALNEIPGVTSGEWLAQPDAATTVRVQDGATVTTDGPFAETKEALGGYFMFEGDDLDAAVAVAARVPATRSAARSRSTFAVLVAGRAARRGCAKPIKRRSVPPLVRSRA